MWVTLQHHIFLLRLAWQSVWEKVLLIVMSVICVCHTSSHLRTHTFTSSDITSSYLHLHILTPSHSHSHIFTSSQLTSSFFLSLTLTSSHLHSHIQTHTLSSSFTHIFTYWHLLFLSLALTSSHFLLLSPLSSLLSLSLLSLSLFSLSPSLSSLFRPRVVPARSHETSTLSHEMRVDAKKPRYNCDFTCAGLVQENLSHEIRVDAQTLR